jgi:hypothetical protein
MLTAVGTLAAVGFYAFSRWNQKQEGSGPALAKSADLNLSAFLDAKMLITVGTFAGVGFYAFSRGVKTGRFGLSPGGKCGPKPVRF